MAQSGQSPNRIRVDIAFAEKWTGYERSTISRWIRTGRFPQPHFLGERRRWFLDELEAWAAERMARVPTDRQGARNITAAEAK
jgi:predicted DNA-binding transcriptional regulator AlpA